jgi:hypothetical protein
MYLQCLTLFAVIIPGVQDHVIVFGLFALRDEPSRFRVGELVTCSSPVDARIYYPNPRINNKRKPWRF